MSHEQAKDVRLTNTKYLQIMWEDRNRTDLISNIYAKRGGGSRNKYLCWPLRTYDRLLGVMFAKYTENLPQIHKH